MPCLAALAVASNKIMKNELEETLSGQVRQRIQLSSNALSRRTEVQYYFVQYFETQSLKISAEAQGRSMPAHLNTNEISSLHQI